MTPSTRRLPPAVPDGSAPALSAQVTVGPKPTDAVRAAVPTAASTTNKKATTEKMRIEAAPGHVTAESLLRDESQGLSERATSGNIPADRWADGMAPPASKTSFGIAPGGWGANCGSTASPRMDGAHLSSGPTACPASFQGRS